MGLVAPWHVGSSWSRDWTHVLALAGGILSTVPPGKCSLHSFKWYSISLERQKIMTLFYRVVGFHCGSAGKESACNVGDLGSIPGLGRSPGEGKGYPLQYSGLENSMDSVVHGVAKKHDWETFTFIFLKQYNLNLSSSLLILNSASSYLLLNLFSKFLKF